VAVQPLQSHRALARAGISAPLVSVVVPVKNGDRSILGLCEALDTQTVGRARFEVIIVDNGSVDRTREVVRDWVARDPPNRQLLLAPGGGPGHARNAGVNAARGEWVAFTDSDTLPESRWLEVALEAFERTGSQALEGSVEPWPVAAIGPLTHQAENSSGGKYMTANMFYRRELLMQVGGFDEQFEQFLEDSDLAFRVMDLGTKIPFVPEARVRHRVIRRSPREICRSTRRLRWISLFARKHSDRYRLQLRPVVRPLYRSDLHVLAGIAAAGALLWARGAQRIPVLLVGANALRVASVSGQVLRGPPREIPARALLSFALPVCRAAWWVEGCLRFRKLTW